jgi:ABC-type cobalamin/Fe3+-siderophores transport system ATPase subunit
VEQPLTLTAENLSVGWTQPVAVIEMLEISPGSISVIAGPNGAGKSTLLKTLARQMRPLEGKVSLNGTDIWETEVKHFAQTVAWVPQMIEPGQDLTVNELVSLGRNPRQQWWSWLSSAQDREAVEKSLRLTDTLDLQYRYLSNLSGGERQRATIAVALAQEAKFLLLDEPTAHLDFRHQLELIDLLKTLKDSGYGIAVVLHDLNLMARLADTILLLEKTNSQASTVASQGPAGLVLRPEILRRVYQVEVSIVPDPDTSTNLYVPARPIKQ